MGCCASSAAASYPLSKNYSQRSKQSRAPQAQLPHPVLEEETVKEVLSETSTPKPTIPKIEDEQKKITHNLALYKVRPEREFEKNDHKKSKWDDAEEASEICSTLSESVSTATLTEKREGEHDGGVIDRSPARLRNRSFSGGLKRDRVLGKSPARRSDLSRARVKSVPGKDTRALVAEEQRRDYCNCSGRRSRSPETRTDGGGSRKGLGRRSSGITGKSPSRVGSELTEKNYGNRENTWPPTSNESLENPLVSLECFIFL